jgi:hypothetical protein
VGQRERRNRVPKTRVFRGARILIFARSDRFF